MVQHHINKKMCTVSVAFPLFYPIPAYIFQILYLILGHGLRKNEIGRAFCPQMNVVEKVLQKEQST
jgi:hypothetical protein